MRNQSRSIDASISAWLIALLCGVFLSCGAKPLDPSGAITAWTPKRDARLEETANSIGVTSFTESDRSVGWLASLRQEESAPDLVLAEWGRDFGSAAAEGLLLDLAPYGKNLAGGGKNPGWITDTGREPASRMVPAALSTWGLIYNKKLLEDSGIAPPESWKALEASFRALKAADVTPIALGASFGWPAGAWLTYIDMRENGGDEHLKLLSGERSFDSRSMVAALKTLENWRDLGYFGNASDAQNWADALNAVVAGRAAFTLVGASAWARVTNRDAVAFMPVPAGSGSRGKRGEIVNLQGYAVRASSARPEAALALALAYAHAGAPGLTGDQYRVSAFPAPSDAEDTASQGTADDLKSTERKILAAARRPVPQMDRAMTAQEAYDFNRFMTGFFDAQKRESAEETAAKLAAAIKRNR